MALVAEAYPQAEPMPCATFEDALASIASGEFSGRATNSRHS